MSERSYLIAGYDSGKDHPVMRVRANTPKEALAFWVEALETAEHPADVVPALRQLWTEELMAGKDSLSVMDPGLKGYISITIERR